MTDLHMLVDVFRRYNLAIILIFCCFRAMTVALTLGCKLTSFYHYYCHNKERTIGILSSKNWPTV